jgi:hypothetical protein
MAVSAVTVCAKCSGEKLGSFGSEACRKAASHCRSMLDASTAEAAAAATRSGAKIFIHQHISSIAAELEVQTFALQSHSCNTSRLNLSCRCCTASF